MLTQSTSQTQVNTPQVWNQPTAKASVGDVFHIPSTPIMQVVEKNTLPNGKIWLLVKPVSASGTEEWILEPEPVQTAQPPQFNTTDTESQPLANSTDSSVTDLQQPDWEAIEEYEKGVAHGKLDAANRLQPICAKASCPYSSGYLDGYNSFLNARQTPPVAEPPKISIVYDSKWGWYQVWVGDRCLREKAGSHEEGKKIACKYMAAEKLHSSHRELVLATYTE
jgi:hypothetical protein